MATTSIDRDATASRIHDWNEKDRRGPVLRKRPGLLDETLRDGLQSPAARDPRLEDKRALVRLMSRLGIDAVDLGLPGAGPRAQADVLALLRTIVDERLPIRANCAARTVLADITPAIEVSQRLAEGGHLDQLVAHTRTAITAIVAAGLPATFVTEDTTRSHPATLDRLFRTAIESGASRLVLCDTCGHATPDGVRNLVAFTRGFLRALDVDERVQVDWHGHNDRGHALTNALVALEWGVDRVHGCGLGIGERTGNTPIDLVLLNLHLLGVLDPSRHDRHALVEYVERVSAATGVPIPASYPLAGRDAFRTATGVHAAAVAKARAVGDLDLADRVYSSVPAHAFGREQEIAVGHYSGRANVVWWLRQHGYEARPELVARVLEHAKGQDRILADEELHALARG